MLTVGIRCGVRAGARTAYGAPGTWSVDADSGIAAPATADEWASIVALKGMTCGSPEHLWLFQEASGNLAAAIGGKTLMVTGSPAYAQDEGGWARSFIGASGAAANQFASATGMAASTTSAMFLAYARIVAPVAGHQRVFYGGSSSNAFEGIAGSPNIRLRVGAQSGNGARDHADRARPYVVVHDVTNSRSVIYSDQERRSITFAARSGNAIQFQFGIAADITASTSFGYAAAWSGAAVERPLAADTDAMVRGIVVGLGWTVSNW